MSPCIPGPASEWPQPVGRSSGDLSDQGPARSNPAIAAGRPLGARRHGARLEHGDARRHGRQRGAAHHQVPSATRDQPGAIRLSQPAGRWVLVATVLGSSMAMLDGTVVNVALPTIGRHLDASLGGLQWTVTAYTLALAGLILLGGALGDRLGRRKVFLTGVAWFALASALCGLAPDIGVLIAARVLQGIGGALLVPGSLAIIQATFDPEDRPRAVGAWSGLGGVAGAVGPLLGGWIVVAAGWRWVFLLNLPLAALVIAVTMRHVPETRDPSASGGFDVSGAVLAALSLAGITYAL